MREPTTEPTVMIDELLYWIHQNEMGGDCIDPDHRFFPLYLELLKLKDKIDNDKHDLYVSVSADETKTNK